MKLFSSRKLNLFKVAADPVPGAAPTPIEPITESAQQEPSAGLEGADSFQDIADTVDAGNSAEMSPEDFGSEELAPESLEPDQDPVALLKSKLISVLGEEDDVTLEEEETLEDSTHQLTDED